MAHRRANRRVKHAFLFTVLLACLFGFPSPAWANVGTPLMWATLLHLLFGNAIIGLIEGLILGFVFRLPKLLTVFLMVLANYFSAWVGWCWLLQYIPKAELDLYTAWPYVWKMVVVAYLMTLVLEFPFVALCLWKKDRWFRKALIGSLLIQTVSYILIFGWFQGASGTSLYRNADVVAVSEMKLPENVLLYYISDKDGDVYVRHLGQADDQKVFDLDSVSTYDNLGIKVSASDTTLCDLMASRFSETSNDPEIILVKQSIPKNLVAFDGDADFNRYANAWSFFGPVLQLPGIEESPWKFEAGGWPIEGLSAEKSDGTESVRINFETPFAEWFIRNATHLPGDIVVFQLGSNQICVFDPETKKIALVVKGRGPVAVLEEKPPEKQDNSIAHLEFVRARELQGLQSQIGTAALALDGQAILLCEKTIIDNDGIDLLVLSPKDLSRLATYAISEEMANKYPWSTSSLALNADGSKVLLYNQYINLETGQTLTSLNVQEAVGMQNVNPNPLSISPNGKFALVLVCSYLAREKSTLSVFDLSTGKQFKALTKGEPDNACFISDAQVASVSGDTVTIYNLVGSEETRFSIGKPVTLLPNQPKNLCMKPFAEGKHILISGHKTAAVVDIPTRKTLIWEKSDGGNAFLAANDSLLLLQSHSVTMTASAGSMGLQPAPVLAVIDLATGQRIGEFPLPVHFEALILDEKRMRLYGISFKKVTEYKIDLDKFISREAGAKKTNKPGI